MCNINSYEFPIKELILKDFLDTNYYINKFKNSFFDKNFCFSPEHKEFCDIYIGWQFKENGIIVGNYIPNDIKFTLSKMSDIIINKSDENLAKSPFIKFSYEVSELSINENFYFLIKNKDDVNFEKIQLERKPGNYTFLKYLEKGLNFFYWIFEKALIPKFSNDEELIMNVENADFNYKNPVTIKSITIFGSNQGEGKLCAKCDKVKNFQIPFPIQFLYKFVLLDSTNKFLKYFNKITLG